MKKLILLPLSIFILSGCSFTSSSSNISSSSSTSTSTKIESVVKNEYGEVMLDGYYKAESQTIDFHKMRETYVFKDLPSIGDVNLLVIPVRFKNSTYCDDKHQGYDHMKEEIEKAFFGDASETGWESVASYYEKSSYNKLHISGEVTDWFTLDLTFEEVNNIDPHRYVEPTNYVLREATKWYQENYESDMDFDVNDDGHIDSVWLIYDAPNKNEYHIDWAYTTWDIYNFRQEPSLETPKAYAYAWAGVDFLYTGKYVDENNNKLVDAHTLIHETGHLLGLEDYYDYDGKMGTAGGLDMMDNNIGDHTAYSKYSLGWTNPYVVTGDSEITIKPFESSGDMILIKDNWNHSAMDEYLLIEFYTPTGLNAKDAEDKYAGIYPIMFQKPGIKVYHIDSRLGYFEHDQFKHYTNEVDENDDGYATSTQIAHSNTSSRSSDRDYKLVRLLERGGTSFLNKKGVYAKDSMLFHTGDIFDPIDFDTVFDKEEYFNDGEYINYFMEVVSITDDEATLKFTVIDKDLK